jgi:hypothetical protein
VALSQLALDEDGDVQRALGYLRTETRVKGGEESRLVGEWCGRYVRDLNPVNAWTHAHCLLVLFWAFLHHL